MTPSPGAPSTPTGQHTVPIRIPGRRAMVTMGLLLIVGVVTMAVYGMGNKTPAAATAPGDGDTAAASSAAPALDEAQVAELMARIAADPTDADALLGVGDEYFQIGDYTSAAVWFQKAAAAAPTNVMAQLALGAAEFNAGDLDAAEIHWSQAVQLDPNNVEGHYDLGFLFLNRDPADIPGVKREWSEVIRLAPGTDIAKTVETHLTALASPAPGASGDPAASGGPVGSGDPAASAPVATPVSAPSRAPVATAVPAATRAPVATAAPLLSPAGAASTRP